MVDGVLFLGLALFVGCHPSSAPIEQTLPTQFLIDEEPREVLSRDLLRLTEGGVSGTAAWDAQKVEDAAGKAWKVRIGKDQREGLLAISGRPRVWSVRVASTGARLLGAFGLDRAVSSTVTASVKTRFDGREDTLWERTFAAGKTPPGWTDFALDLTPWSGREVDLLFEAVWPEPEGISARADLVLDPGMGLAVWGSVAVSEAQQSPARPNLLLFSVDTLRADRLSASGYALPTTPHLEKWLNQRPGLVFSQAISPSPWTLPAHASLFTGLDALRHGVNRQRPMPTELISMTQRLRESGYATVAMVAGGYVSAHWGFDRGFRTFSSRKSRTENDDELARGVDELIDSLGSLPQPWFVFFHTYEVHTPFTAREPFFSAFGGDSRELGDGLLLSRRTRPADGSPHVDEFVVSPSSKPRDGRPLTSRERVQVSALYDSSVAYTDAQLGRVFARLEHLNLLDQTDWILTSDHGELLGEHGLDAHGYLHEENLRVPLLVSFSDTSQVAWADGPSSVTRHSAPVMLTDVAPTLLELAGAEPLPGADGRSLVPFLRQSDRAAQEASPRPYATSYAGLHNRGLSLRRADGLKLMFRDAAWRGVAGQAMLFDLHDDPEELNDLWPEADEEVRDRWIAAAEAEFASARGHYPLRVTHSQQGATQVRLHSSALSLNSVTMETPHCDCVVPSPSGLTLELTDQQEVALRVESSKAPELDVFLTHAGVTTPIGALDVSSLPSTTCWGRGSSNSYTRSSDPPVGGRGTVCLFMGSTVAFELPEQEAEALDPQLVEELESLGYLGH